MVDDYMDFDDGNDNDFGIGWGTNIVFIILKTKIISSTHTQKKTTQFTTFFERHDKRCEIFWYRHVNRFLLFDGEMEKEYLKEKRKKKKT